MKKIIKQFLHAFGFDIIRYNAARSNAAQLNRIMSEHHINLVLDIGANTGQFACYLRDMGYRGQIVSFEPLTSARDNLILNSKRDPLWDIAPQAAIGSTNGETTIYISGNSVSSSILNMLDVHAVAAPDSVYIGKEIVPLRRLDSLAKIYVSDDSILFIKIDTQGYEDRVIEGASELLQQTAVLQLELSLVPLYEGQCLCDEMIANINALGFYLWAISPVLTDEHSGRLLQIDATFCKKQ